MRTRPGALTTFAAVVSAIVMTLIFALPLFQGVIYTEDDLIAQVLPLRAFYQQCLRTGGDFIWMPGLHMGFYLHGEGHVGMYHPAHWLLYRFLPLDSALNIELIGSYPLLLIGMYLFLRRHALPAFAALFGAFTFTYCGFVLNHYVHLPYATSLAHLPWLLLAVNTILTTEKPCRVYVAAVMLTLLTASQFLLGQPHPMYWCLIIEIAYAVYLWPQSRGLHRYFHAVIALELALLIGAVQWLPSKEAVERSVRAETTYEFSTADSLHPLNFLQFFSPYMYHRRMYGPISWDAVYIGAATLVLALWIAFHPPRGPAARRFVMFLCMLAVAGLVLALGKYTPLYRIVWQVPVLNLFRAPGRHIVITHFALSTLAAIALAAVSTKREGGGDSRSTMWLAGLPAAAAWVIAAVYFVALFLPDAPLKTTITSGRNVLIGAVLFTISAILTTEGVKGRYWAIPALILFAAVDISLYSFRHKDRMSLAYILDNIELPPDMSSYRVTSYYQPNFGVNTPTMKGVRLHAGHLGLVPVKVLDYDTDAALRVASIGWKKVPYGDWPEAAFQPDRGERWERVPDPMPRARLVPNAVVSGNMAEDIKRLDLRSTALVGSPIELGGGEPGDVELLDDRPGDITLLATAPVRQLVVVSESYHPGWRAYVDGREATVVAVYGDFIGCVVGPGEHRVRFDFDPRSLRDGKRLAVVGLVLLGIYSAAGALVSR